MMCNDVEKLLPAYLEGLLSGEEENGIVKHVASCPRCSRSLSDLKRAEQLVRGLEEMEPPPFFEQKIMSRVREEASRKQGILHRLFFPLRIKLPIQALATIFLAVLAFHIYQAGDPEMKQMTPLPAPPAGSEKGSFTAEPPKSAKQLSDAESSKRAPAGDGSEKNGERFSASPVKKEKQQSITEPQAPSMEELPAVRKPGDTLLEERGEGLQPAGPGSTGQAEVRTEKREAGRAVESQPAQKRKERMSDVATLGARKEKAMSVPVPPAAGTAEVRSAPVIGLTIQVDDAGTAVREIESRLVQVDGRIIDRRYRNGNVLLKVEIAAKDFTGLLDLLEGLGKVRQDRDAVAWDGNATVDIHVIGHP